MVKILSNKSLKSYNTFGLDVSARYLAEVHSVDDMRKLIQSPEYKLGNPLFLGGGSNVLLTKDVEGLVIRNLLKGISIVSEDANNVFVKAASGEVWHEFVLFCIEKGWAGVENLSLIPGSVGAGPMQNIGAYGVELKDVFHELEALNLDTLELEVFSKDQCKFGYRESVFKHELKNKYFISSVTFKLSVNATVNTSYGAIKQQLDLMHVENPGIKEVSDAVIAIRSSKLPNPKVLGNAGSFFKNPEVDASFFSELKSANPTIVGYPLDNGQVKLAAGWLIEQCGWKGKVVGNCGSHKDQALVLVNYGGATGSEVYALALAIKSSVFEKFGVEINPEVNVI
jgi:UDP-N-acetylmuramate dehydrogenase